MPLIDFERADDSSALRSIPARLTESAGRGPVLLTMTSITTLRAFADAGSLSALRSACATADVSVAAVGRATGNALRAEGITPDIEPTGAMNAEGMLALLAGTAPGTAFLPQADIAAPTLAEGLERLGWSVVVVQAYRTVDAPADPDRRLTASLHVAQNSHAKEGPEGDVHPGSGKEPSARVLEPAEAAREQWDAVLGMSPSSARRIVEVLGRRPEGRPFPPFAAIGPSTAAEARSLGISVTEVAEQPTPERSAAALARAAASARTVSGGQLPDDDLRSPSDSRLNTEPERNTTLSTQESQ